MSKIRLDIDAITVETFTTTPTMTQRGTLFGYESERQTRCDRTCNFDAGCYNSGDMCTADCTGVGVYCYTADPNFYDCTGGDACSGGAGCTNTTCTIDNVTCMNCG